MVGLAALAAGRRRARLRGRTAPRRAGRAARHVGDAAARARGRRRSPTRAGHRAGRDERGHRARCPPSQTYLDITQGNRLSTIALRPVRCRRSTQHRGSRARDSGTGDRRPGRGAPADIVPGLLASSLAARGDPVARLPAAAGSPARLSGAGATASYGCEPGCPGDRDPPRGRRRPRSLVTRPGGRRSADRLRSAAAGRATARSHRDRRAGIRRRRLTSDSTRMRRLRPLHGPRADDPRRLGMAVPRRRWTVSRSDPRAEVDAAAVEDLADRIGRSRPPRPVVIASTCSSGSWSLRSSRCIAPARRAGRRWLVLALAMAFVPADPARRCGDRAERDWSSGCWSASARRGAWRSPARSLLGSAAGGRWRSPRRDHRSARTRST